MRGIESGSLSANRRYEKRKISCVYYTASECTVISGRILVDTKFYLHTFIAFRLVTPHPVTAAEFCAINCVCKYSIAMLA
jgi:hypothetical protein